MYSPMPAARACCLLSPSETEGVPLKDAANAHTRRFECMHAYGVNLCCVSFSTGVRALTATTLRVSREAARAGFKRKARTRLPRCAFQRRAAKVSPFSNLRSRNGVDMGRVCACALLSTPIHSSRTANVFCSFFLRWVVKFRCLVAFRFCPLLFEFGLPSAPATAARATLPNSETYSVKIIAAPCPPPPKSEGQCQLHSSQGLLPCCVCVVKLQ